jgi:hypothetical protein
MHNTDPNVTSRFIMVVHACNPMYAEGVDKKILVVGWSWQKA